MSDLARMALFANLFVRYKHAYYKEVLSSHRKKGKEWTSHDGFRSISINHEAQIVLYNNNNFLSCLCEGYEFELVEVTGDIKPHCHHKSDGVILCLPDARDHKGYFEFGSEGMWVRLGEDQLIILPRGKVHGFRIMDDYGSLTKSFHLLSISYPRVADDDTCEKKG